MSDLIYKVVDVDLWASANEQDQFQGAPVDLTDGFIHFSTAAQVKETVAKHFAGVGNLLIIGIDPDKLGEQLRWEPSRGGDLFPHLYGPLLLDAVVSVDPLPLGDDQKHVFPGDLTA